MSVAEGCEQHVHDVQRVGKFDVCVDCGEIVSERWEPTSLDDVEYLLSLRFEEQVQIAALRRRIANLQQLVARHEQRDRWLESRWKPAVRDIVAAHLFASHGRRRSIDTEYGRLGVRRNPGSIDVMDARAALEWCKQHRPEAVKTVETVLKNPLKGSEADLPRDAFRVKPPADEFYVDIASV